MVAGISVDSSTAERSRVVVAMSGGVDSTVAAALLKSRGHEIVGVTLKLRECGGSQATRSCCGVDGLVRAAESADLLGIRHHVLDCVREFEERVLGYAWDEYAAGRTPSPCLLCNERIKFGLLFEWAESQGATHVATGHYARVERDAVGNVRLLRGTDSGKDQSYFLAGLTAEQLSHVLFPLGALTKKEVRALAGKGGLPCADAPESQDACLVQAGESFAEMLRLRHGGTARPGTVVDDSGTVLGRHDGIHLFTIGQRRGIPVQVPCRLWVRRIDAGAGVVHVTAEESGLDCSGLSACGMSWVRGAPPAGRFRCEEKPAEVTCSAPDRVTVRFDSPARALTPGQAAVLYDGDEVLGRGWIDSTP
ncbi:MAG: tRNA 2-thiouridine(34) synthase MnmA [Deltaproteobacteria bacterium]|nr:tRNA 2-thiouridine(34) synthase MnmA [Deltaproteobacteria bacterium]